MNGYVSNTLCAGGNQSWFTVDGSDTGLVYMRVFRGGEMPYVFGFSNIIDSTFGDGSFSKMNDVCDWDILDFRIAVTKDYDPETADNLEYKPVYFNGRQNTRVEKYTYSDEIILNAEKDDYLCMKISFSGAKIPCHKETQLPVLRKNNGKWELNPDVPMPFFRGVKRDVKKKIAFFGDSITQGIGAGFDSYSHYAALAGKALGEDYAVWNIGLGYGRAQDAASDGIWLEKAKQNDVVSVCFGVNDIHKGRTEEQLKADLKFIACSLKNAGVKLILQTIPPFDYDKESEKIWRAVNGYIKTELSQIADVIFDNNPILSENGADSPKAKFGGHPNADGHSLWADALLPVIKSII